MKTFKNSKGVKIFELDYNGNLFISGDLTLSPESTITAGNIKALVDADVAVIRESIDMVTPYLGKADVVYYLGENTEEYTYGTWWEKYTIGYNCTIDVSYTKVPGFTVYEGNASFYVTDSGVYNYNKEVLDSYPTTNKIVVTAINGSDIAHWEIKYYNDSTLLYTDLIESAYFTATGYNFPFSPINSEDYPEGSTDIIINVLAEHALREINAIDWESFMPKTGGDFLGIISTKDITPLQADTYSIGTETGRYKNGYFSNIYTGYLKTNTLSIENLNLELFTLSSTKTNLVPGDGLVITDGADNNTVKTSDTLKFSGDKTKYLRQDGVFALVDTTIKNVQDILAELEIPNTLIRYTGNTVESLIQDNLYTGGIQDGKYQILFTGIAMSFVTNACVINDDNIDFSSRFINLFNTLFNESIQNIIERDGKIILNYTKNTGWTVKLYELYGVVTAQLIKDAGIEDLVYELNNAVIYIRDSEDGSSYTYLNNYFNIKTISDNAQIIINKFIWEPVNKTDFDFINRDFYLSKAGTWERKAVNVPSFTISWNSTSSGLDLDSIKIEEKLAIRGLTWVKTADSYSALGEVKSGTILGLLYSDYIMSKPKPNSRPTPYYRQILHIYDDNQIKKYSREGFLQGSPVNGQINIDWKQWKKIIDENVEVAEYKNLRVPTKDEWNYIINEMGFDRRGIIMIGNRKFFCINPKCDYVDLLFSYDGEIKTLSLEKAKSYIADGKCILLPMTGYRIGDEVFETDTALYATSSTDGSLGYFLNIEDTNSSIVLKDAECWGAVRLVTQDSSIFKVDPIVINGLNLYFAPCNLQTHFEGAYFICRLALNFYDVIKEDNIFGDWRDLHTHSLGISALDLTINVVNFKNDYYLTQQI